MFPFWSRFALRLSPLHKAADEVIRLANLRQVTIVTAESLTGGLIGATLTSIPGSSRSFWGGFIVYSPEAKTRLLGVPAGILRGFGAVSRETAESMARGALAASGADIAVAVTGVAGPGGGTVDTPVGTVWIALASAVSPGGDDAVKGGGVFSARYRFRGSRRRVRAETALRSLRLLAAQLDR